MAEATQGQKHQETQEGLFARAWHWTADAATDFASRANAAQAILIRDPARPDAYNPLHGINIISHDVGNGVAGTVGFAAGAIPGVFKYAWQHASEIGAGMAAAEGGPIIDITEAQKADQARPELYKGSVTTGVSDAISNSVGAVTNFLGWASPEIQTPGEKFLSGASNVVGGMVGGGVAIKAVKWIGDGVGLVEAAAGGAKVAAPAATGAVTPDVVNAAGNAAATSGNAGSTTVVNALDKAVAETPVVLAPQPAIAPAVTSAVAPPVGATAADAATVAANGAGTVAQTAAATTVRDSVAEAIEASAADTTAARAAAKAAKTATEKAATEPAAAGAGASTATDQVGAGLPGEKLPFKQTFNTVRDKKMPLDEQLGQLIRGGRTAQAQRMVDHAVAHGIEESDYTSVLRQSSMLNETEEGRALREVLVSTWKRRNLINPIRHPLVWASNHTSQMANRFNYAASGPGYALSNPGYTAYAAGRMVLPTIGREAGNIAALPFTTVAQIPSYVPFLRHVPGVGKLAGMASRSFTHGALGAGVLTGADFATGDHLGVVNGLSWLYGKEFGGVGWGLEGLSDTSLVNRDPTGIAPWTLWGMGKGAKTAGEFAAYVPSLLGTTSAQAAEAGRQGSGTAITTSPSGQKTTVPAFGNAASGSNEPGDELLSQLESALGSLNLSGNWPAMIGGVIGLMKGGSWTGKFALAGLFGAAGAAINSKAGREFMSEMKEDAENILQGKSPNPNGAMATIWNEVKAHPIAAGLMALALTGGSGIKDKMTYMLGAMIIGIGIELWLGQNKIAGFTTGIGEGLSNMFGGSSSGSSHPYDGMHGRTFYNQPRVLPSDAPAPAARAQAYTPG